MKELFAQLVAAFVSTTCFSLLLHIPKQHLIWCGMVGMEGWFFYWAMMQAETGPVAASFVAVIPLAIGARICSITRKAPVTIFLISGIFPLVPGAGIYYTAYSFIMGDSAGFSAKGTETLKIAAALAMGIAMVMSIPIKRSWKAAPPTKPRQLP